MARRNAIKLQIALLLYGVTFLLFWPIIGKSNDQPVQMITIPEPEPIVEVAEIKAEARETIELSRISAYNPVVRQTDSDPHISSCGPNLEKQIAVSQDLFFDQYGRKHLCGTVVTIITDRGEVFEDYVIWDTMNPRYEATVDIMLNTTEESLAFQFGITAGKLLIH